MIDNTNNIFKKTFIWMFIGLMITGVISWFTYQSNFMAEVLVNFFMPLVIIELVVVMAFSFGFKKLPANVVAILFIVYAIINGLMFSTIFYTYELNSITFIFFGTAILFLILGLIGYNTEANLSGMGRILLVALFIGIIMTIINIFLNNSMLDIILTWAILLIFCGLTIYDINRLKHMANEIDNTNKLHIYFAMQLYLDFINIFLKLLRLFGNRK